MASYGNQNDLIANANYSLGIINGRYQLDVSGSLCSGDNSYIGMYAEGYVHLKSHNELIQLETPERVHVNCSTESTSCDTGALVVDGGAGIGGSLYACGTDFSLGPEATPVISGSSDDYTLTINADVTINGCLDFSDCDEGLVIGGDLEVDGCVIIRFDHCLRFLGSDSSAVEVDIWDISRQNPADDDIDSTMMYYDDESGSTVAHSYDAPLSNLYITRPTQSADIMFRQTVVYEYVLGSKDIYGWQSSSSSNGDRGKNQKVYDANGDLTVSGRGVATTSTQEYIYVNIPQTVPDYFKLTWWEYRGHIRSTEDSDDFGGWIYFQRRRYDKTVWETISQDDIMNATGYRSNENTLSETELVGAELRRWRYEYRFMIKINFDKPSAFNNDYSVFLHTLRTRWEGHRVLPLRPRGVDPSGRAGLVDDFEPDGS
jgi:hypothetical protein